MDMAWPLNSARGRSQSRQIEKVSLFLPTNVFTLKRSQKGSSVCLSLLGGKKRKKSGEVGQTLGQMRYSWLSYGQIKDAQRS